MCSKESLSKRCVLIKRVPAGFEYLCIDKIRGVEKFQLHNKLIKDNEEGLIVLLISQGDAEKLLKRGHVTLHSDGKRLDLPVEGCSECFIPNEWIDKFPNNDLSLINTKKNSKRMKNVGLTKEYKKKNDSGTTVAQVAVFSSDTFQKEGVKDTTEAQVALFSSDTPQKDGMKESTTVAQVAVFSSDKFQREGMKDRTVAQVAVFSSDTLQKEGIEEMKKKTPQTISKVSDSLFGNDEEEGIDEDIKVHGEMLPMPETEEKEGSENLEMETDSEGILMMNPKPKCRHKTVKTVNLAANVVTVSISHLSFNENATLLDNDNVKQLYVAYNFLGVDPEELETPFSLPKPKANIPIAYKFVKNFPVDFQTNYVRRQYLAAMLLPDDPEQGRIRITVVNEPPDDDMDNECEEVGVAFVCVKDILKTKQDVEEQDIDLLDVKNETEVIGTLNVTVKCLAALEAVEKEMQI